MVFVDNITDLEYYTPNPRFGCYGDPIFAPYDILLQANGFIVASDCTTVIKVCDPSGAELENATSYFDTFLSTFVVAGVTYYFVNIRCDHYSPAMLSNKCFVLHVQITDSTSGAVVFDKYTQKYIISNAGAIFAGGVTINNGVTSIDLDNCVPAPNEASCNTPYIKFSCNFDCVDAYNGDFYQEGSVVSGTGNFPFNFERSSWIEGRIRKIPKAVKRVISINCRTQKSETTPKYLLTGGNVVFPIWKVDEIENMLLANKLFVDSVEYQSEGGTIFEQFGKLPFNCQYAYKLTMPLQKCLKWQIFGCVPTCEDLAAFYAFPRAFSRVYDDSERLIATSPDELEIYFAGSEGARTVQQLPFVLPCPVYALFKVRSSGVLPKYLFVDEIAPASRIFPKQLAANSVNLEALCNGVTFDNQIPTPDVTGGENITIEVPVPDIVGGENQDANDYILQITGNGDWALNNNYSSAANYEGEVTLNISVSADFQDNPLSNVVIAQISGNGRPNGVRVIYGNDNPNLPNDSMVVIGTDGTITYTGVATNVVNDTYFVEFFGVRYNINTN